MGEKSIRHLAEAQVGPRQWDEKHCSNVVLFLLNKVK